MSFEAEVIPMFIGGCAAVSALEFAAGWLILRSRKAARDRFAGHLREPPRPDGAHRLH